MILLRDCKTVCRALFLLATLVLLGSFSAQAQNRITVELGKAIVLPHQPGIISVFVADNTIADASVADGGEIYVYGKEIGETTLFTSVGDGEEQHEYTLVVTHNLSEIQRTIAERFPDAAVSISSSRGSVLISGHVASEGTRQAVLQTIEAGVPQAAVIDQMSVTSSNIVRLRVRLLEVNRSRADNYGINWDATVASNGFFLGANDSGVLTFGNDQEAATSLTATLDVLTSSGIVSIVQETLLSTVTGQSAEFSVGAEIPIPSFISDSQEAANGYYQLDYKFIGTSLNFQPVSSPGGKLRLDIDSTISSADSSTTTVNGNTFPNLRSRAIRTSVELEDRQSFIIAGISRNDSEVNLRNAREGGFSRAVDNLFGADSARSTSQELVIVVTPILSDEEPISAAEALPKRMTNLEYILTGGPSGTSKGTLNLHAGLAAGFEY
jgi:pilus assembly protein CpaC